MYTTILLVLALALAITIFMLNRRLRSAAISNRINAVRIVWDICGVVAACAALSLVLQLHGLK